MAQRPNILFLMSDEHSPHAIGYEGNSIVQTPNLDRLAASGTYFESAYCQVPLCTPSRMCMLTGKHAHRCSAWDNGSILYPEHLTMPAHFAQHGYATALVGKMHFGGKEQHNGFQSRPLRRPTRQCRTPNRPPKSAISHTRTDTTCRCHRNSQAAFYKSALLTGRPLNT